MKTFAALFIASFVLSYILTPLMVMLSRARGWVDHPSEERKIHEKPTPTLGGIPIFFSILIPLCVLFYWPNDPGNLFREKAPVLLGLLIGILLMLCLGIYDDRKGAGHRIKFSVQILAAVVVYFFDFKISIISLPFGLHLNLGHFALPFTILWVVGITNAINLIDGIDGLAAGVSLFATAALFVVSVIFERSFTSAIAVAMCGALLGFLRYNFYPAQIFLGDSGSLVIGFLISAIGIRGSYKGATMVALAIPILALGVPIMDTLLAIWRRLWARKPVFSGDRDHIHHRLIEQGLSQSKAALLLYGLTVFFGVMAFLITLGNSQEIALTLLAFGIVTVVVIQRLGYFTRNNDRRPPTADRGNNNNGGGNNGKKNGEGS